MFLESIITRGINLVKCFSLAVITLVRTPIEWFSLAVITLVRTPIEWFSPAGYTVKVHVVTAGITFGADEDLMRQVSKGLLLVKSDRKESHVTILFCPISSRVGSDVEAALSMVSGEEKVILVLMHHTRDENFSSAGTKWSEVYPNVILDVHVLYHESVDGLLTCSQNSDAVSRLLHDLKRLQ